MKSTTKIKTTALLLVASLWGAVGFAKGDDFDSVVRVIEQFYNVKHQGLPFLAKAGMKVAGVSAKLKGGTAKRLAEAGSIKLAVFDDQEFNEDFITFRKTLNGALHQTWMPLIQTFSAAGGEQTYIFLREKGDKFNVLVITIERRDATVVQATLSSRNLALLMKDPEDGAKTITREATIIDQE